MKLYRSICLRFLIRDQNVMREKNDNSTSACYQPINKLDCYKCNQMLANKGESSVGKSSDINPGAIFSYFKALISTEYTETGLDPLNG